ncbi:hypothetical protein SAMN04489762_2389 [Terribacillus saccharophilus]|uniref:Uncharacterized protein n=1 Tax=Terribacillus saccharophilus TaxID=361277 RepID=A0AAX2EGX8_9BACI|nr:hypothetical protein SAMN04489762_2389 [Terribacillus saccharophilus]
MKGIFCWMTLIFNVTAGLFFFNNVTWILNIFVPAPIIFTLITLAAVSAIMGMVMSVIRNKLIELIITTLSLLSSVFGGLFMLLIVMVSDMSQPI